MYGRRQCAGNWQEFRMRMCNNSLNFWITAVVNYCKICYAFIWSNKLRNADRNSNFVEFKELLGINAKFLSIPQQNIVIVCKIRKFRTFLPLRLWYVMVFAIIAVIIGSWTVTRRPFCGMYVNHHQIHSQLQYFAKFHK